MSAKSRLWEKGEDIDAVVHRFTVGKDPEIDKNILRWDAIGSAAQAKMLTKIGIITETELKQILPVLKEVLTLADRGEFEIPVEMEDAHTAIENFLVEKLGEAGKKIHTGRSRNDQVVVTMRLYLRNELENVLRLLGDLAQALFDRAQKDGNQDLPGYTHMQKAMPASIGMWLASYGEWALEAINDGLRLVDGIDCNPLGAAAGFDVPLPLDREYVAKLLGFSRVQRNAMAVMNSRGRFELKALKWLSDIGAMIEKISWDMILYSMEDLGFISIPVAFTTGSSIMPQKKNPDVLELLRGRASVIRGKEAELSAVISKLPCSYHRDYQLTKEPVIDAFAEAKDSLLIIAKVVTSFTINSDAIAAAMSAELYATYDAYNEVLSGLSFRDAYRKTAQKVKERKIDVLALKSEFDKIQKKVENEISLAVRELGDLKTKISSFSGHLKKVEDKIFE